MNALRSGGSFVYIPLPRTSARIYAKSVRARTIVLFNRGETLATNAGNNKKCKIWVFYVYFLLLSPQQTSVKGVVVWLYWIPYRQYLTCSVPRLSTEAVWAKTSVSPLYPPRVQTMDISIFDYTISANVMSSSRTCAHLRDRPEESDRLWRSVFSFSLYPRDGQIDVSKGRFLSIMKESTIDFLSDKYIQYLKGVFLESCKVD